MGQTRRDWVRANVLNAGQVAAELGITANSVYVYSKRYPDFPQPVLEDSRCKMWLRAEIVRWKRERKR